jgi:hypothetical protein
MKRITMLIAAIMVLALAVGCVTTVPEKNYYTSIKKNKSCK